MERVNSSRIMAYGMAFVVVGMFVYVALSMLTPRTLSPCEEAVVYFETMRERGGDVEEQDAAIWVATYVSENTPPDILSSYLSAFTTLFETMREIPRDLEAVEQHTQDVELAKESLVLACGSPVSEYVGVP